MTREYLKSCRFIVEKLLELMYSYDFGQISEMEFYRQWTATGMTIIETRDDQNAGLEED